MHLTQVGRPPYSERAPGQITAESHTPWLRSDGLGHDLLCSRTSSFSCTFCQHLPSFMHYYHHNHHLLLLQGSAFC